MSEKLQTDPQEAIEDMGEMGEMSENMDMEMSPEDSDNLPSFLGPLNNTEPDEDIDEVDEFRIGEEYVGKYLQRGVNKFVGSQMTALMDFVMAGISGMWVVFSDNSEESEESENSEMNDNPSIVTENGET